jgi:hypothetical protein
MLRRWVQRASGAWDDRVIVAAATTMLLVVGGIASLLLLTLSAFKAVLWLSGIRPRVERTDDILNW